MTRKRCDHTWPDPERPVGPHVCARPPSHQEQDHVGHMCYCGERDGAELAPDGPRNAPTASAAPGACVETPESAHANPGTRTQ